MTASAPSSAAPQAAPSAPHPHRPRGRMRWLWLVVALVLVGGVGAAVVGLRHYFVPITVYEHQTRQMTGIAAKIDELGQAVTTPPPPSPTAATEELTAHLTRLEEKLATPPAPATPEPNPQLEQRLIALETRLQAIEDATRSTATLFRIAVHQQAALITELVAQGEPFLAELDLLQTLGTQSALALPSQQLNTLLGVARFGVPSSRTLAEELDSLTKTIELVIPAEKPARSSNEITGALASFINLRRIDGAAGARRKDALDLITAAREHLHDNNIPAALETLMGLPEDVQADIAYESWTERAQLALKARDAAALLQDVTAAIASGNPTPGSAGSLPDAQPAPPSPEDPLPQGDLTSPSLAPPSSPPQSPAPQDPASRDLTTPDPAPPPASAGDAPRNMPRNIPRNTPNDTPHNTPHNTPMGEQP